MKLLHAQRERQNSFLVEKTLFILAHLLSQNISYTEISTSKALLFILKMKVDKDRSIQNNQMILNGMQKPHFLHFGVWYVKF